MLHVLEAICYVNIRTQLRSVTSVEDQSAPLIENEVRGNHLKLLSCEKDYRLTHPFILKKSDSIIRLSYCGKGHIFCNWSGEYVELYKVVMGW